jgi:hypothetical protein
MLARCNLRPSSVFDRLDGKAQRAKVDAGLRRPSHPTAVMRGRDGPLPKHPVFAAQRNDYLGAAICGVCSPIFAE